MQAHRDMFLSTMSGATLDTEFVGEFERNRRRDMSLKDKLRLQFGERIRDLAKKYSRSQLDRAWDELMQTASSHDRRFIIGCEKELREMLSDRL
jgi:hypothetical protein